MTTSSIQESVQEPSVQEPSTGHTILAGPQTVEMDAQRYKFFRGFLLSKAKALCELIGSGENAPLSETDEGVFEDGSPDIDFEESTIEILTQIEVAGLEIAQMASRFRHNVTVRLQGSAESETTPEA